MSGTEGAEGVEGSGLSGRVGEVSSSCIRFSRVDLSVDGDAYGFVTSIDPAYYEDLGADDAGSVLNFTLTFRGTVAATSEDQLYRLTLNVLGDSSILLDTLDIIVVVPGTAF